MDCAAACARSLSLIRRRFKQEVFFITEQDKQAKNGAHLTVSQQYGCQHDVLLYALWSLLATGGREWWAPSGGRAAPNTHGYCVCKSTLNVKVHPSLLSGCGVEMGQVHYPDQRFV